MFTYDELLILRLSLELNIEQLSKDIVEITSREQWAGDYTKLSLFTSQLENSKDMIIKIEQIRKTL
jgi:hypothetical protein